MGILDKEFNSQQRKWRQAILPENFDGPMCPGCGLLYSTWEEAWECHWDEMEEDAIFNEIIAIQEGRIDGEFYCKICGMQSHDKEEAKKCCSPAGISRDLRSPVYVFDTPYFRVVDYAIYDIIAELIKKMTEEEWSRSLIAKQTMKGLAKNREEKISIMNADRIRQLDSRIVDMIAHKEFFKEDKDA